jgi:hypothetical protein
MRRGAGAGPPRSRSLGTSTVALLSGFCALVFACSAGLVEPVSSALAVTSEASAASTAPAPDPKPPQPQPDKKPPPPAPTPPPPAPTPSPLPPPPPPPPPPAAQEPTPTVASTPPRVSETRANPARRAGKARPSAPRKVRQRVKAKRVERTPPPKRRPQTLSAGTLAATPATELGKDEPASSTVVVAFAALSALGLLMLGLAAVPPRRVPWPVLAGPLFVHRGNLAITGVGTILVSLLCLNVAALL